MICYCGNRKPHRNKYCSSGCYQNDRRSVQVPLTCEWCGEEFKVPSYRNTNRKRFCSNTCRIESSAQSQLGENNPSWKHGESTRRGGSWRYSKYGITAREYDQLLEQQNGVCAICQNYHDILCVDHDHETGEVRGLLCRMCNSGLGFLGDSILGIIKAVKYLQNPPAQG